MEESTSENSNSKKRARDDSGELESNSPESKRVHVMTESDPNPSDSERVDTETKPDLTQSNEPEHDSEDNPTESNGLQNEFGSPEVVKFREAILDILDEPEMGTEIQNLDSVIRSLEEEILLSSPSLPQAPAVELTSDSGESQPDLGYLLEASDDELGLPPTFPEAQSENEPTNISIGDEGLGDIVGFENELAGYDSFEFGLGERVPEANNEDFVTVDGLFDYSDGSDFGWRPESLPAL